MRAAAEGHLARVIVGDALRLAPLPPMAKVAVGHRPRIRSRGHIVGKGRRAGQEPRGQRPVEVHVVSATEYAPEGRPFNGHILAPGSIGPSAEALTEVFVHDDGQSCADDLNRTRTSRARITGLPQ